MMMLIDTYWPAMVIALLIGIISGVLAFRPKRQRSMAGRRKGDR